MKHLLSISAHNSSLYHLRAKSPGNVRQVTDADGKVVQDNHYYPYGMLMGESSDILATARGGSLTNLNPYLYGSKEYLTTGGANLLDFTARTYDPSLPLFQTQYPKSGDYTSFLPYLYCGADPVNRIDPDGEKLYFLIWKGVSLHLMKKWELVVSVRPNMKNMLKVLIRL